MRTTYSKFIFACSWLLIIFLLPIVLISQSTWFLIVLLGWNNPALPALDSPVTMWQIYEQLLHMAQYPWQAPGAPIWLSEQELQHMHDVQNLLLAVYAVIFVSICVWALLVVTHKREVIFCWTSYSTRLLARLLVVMSFVVAIIVLTWPNSFIALHQIFFPFNTNWRLDPATSNIIRFLPESYFQQLGITYIVMILLEYVLMHIFIHLFRYAQQAKTA